jgi:aminodeoxyfutalosine deaminase
MLRVVPDMPSYPIRAFLEHGVRVTINTDDPAIFGCTLTGELLTLVNHGLLNLREVAEIQRDAFRAADIPEDKLTAIEREIDDLIAELEN